MKHTIVRRSVSLLMTLALVLSLAIGARAVQTPETLTELKGTDAVLTDGTEYTYTGQEIRPHVTVMVDRTVLVEGEHYTLAYADNIGVGTGTVTVTGIPAGGYTGTVTLPFTIAKAPGTPEYTLVEIQPEHVTVAGTEFAYTGGPVEPQVTVTVDGVELTENKDYSLRYVNNVEPGKATLTVTGIATASQTLGYTGAVSVDFTILPPVDTDGDAPGGDEVPEATEAPDPEEDPEEETKPEYKFTAGTGGKWSQNSTKDLSFTVNADTGDITEIRIDSKKLDKAHYTLGADGKITLKNSWLKKQVIGTYGITAVFADGQARTTFRVIAQADPTNPSTGDTIGLWTVLMILSGASAAVLIPFGKKKI